jgi:predicted transcriptional regulator
VPQEGGARPRGALEREVLACLAAAGQPLAPGEVLAGLGDSRLAYATVMTTLTRLHAKGAVTREPAGRGYVYALRGDTGDDAQASMTARRMLKLLEGRPDRASVLSQFVADLSPEDEELLTGLLAGDQRAGDAANGAGSPAVRNAGTAAGHDGAAVRGDGGGGGGGGGGAARPGNDPAGQGSPP